MKSKFILLTLVVVVSLAALGFLGQIARTPTPGSLKALPSNLSQASYALFGDVFTLNEGQATLQGHAFSATSTPLLPIGYTLAASSTGQVSMEGNAGSVVALYREFGANLNWVTLFVFDDASPVPQQIASTVAYQGDAEVKSVTLKNGVVTLNLLVVSDADLQKPHYEQTPTVPRTLKFAVNEHWLTPLQ